MAGRTAAVACLLLLAATAAGQETPLLLAPPPPPPADPTRTLTGGSALPQLEAPAVGQQHWAAVSLVALQPTVGRVQVRVLPRENGSLWLEAYGGSVLFNGMYGFGARMQWTAHQLTPADAILVGPGLGVHILPDWYDYEGRGHHPRGQWTTLSYLAGDVDVSWLHDFSPRFGWELGVKVGLAGRLSGRVGRDYPDFVMFGKDIYPIFSIFSGVRF